MRVFVLSERIVRVHGKVTFLHMPNTLHKEGKLIVSREKMLLLYVYTVKLLQC